jgi:hypothetical protein
MWCDQLAAEADPNGSKHILHDRSWRLLPRQCLADGAGSSQGVQTVRLGSGQAGRATSIELLVNGGQRTLTSIELSAIRTSGLTRFSSI